MIESLTIYQQQLNHVILAAFEQVKL